MPTYEPANHRDRLAATGVDLLLALALGAGAATLTASASPELRLAIVLLAVGLPTLLVEGTLGRSPGKAGLHLRHQLPDEPGPALTIPQATARFTLKWLLPTALVAVALPLAAATLWLALYLPALGPTRRTLHDRLTRTQVLGPTETQRADL